MTRAKQYQEFWQTFADLNQAEILPFPALGVINSDYPAGSFVGDISRALRASLQNSEMLADAMVATGKFNSAEINIIRGAEICGNLNIALPVIAGNEILTTALEYKFFWSTLGKLLQCGVPRLTALESSAEPCGQTLKSAAAAIICSLRDGDNFADGMRGTNLFSAYEVEVIDEWEEKGLLETAVELIANQC